MSECFAEMKRFLSPNAKTGHTPFSPKGTFPSRGIETFGAYIPQIRKLLRSLRNSFLWLVCQQRVNRGIAARDWLPAEIPGHAVSLQRTPGRPVAPGAGGALDRESG